MIKAPGLSLLLGDNATPLGARSVTMTPRLVDDANLNNNAMPLSNNATLVDDNTTLGNDNPMLGNDDATLGKDNTTQQCHPWWHRR